MWKKQEKKTVEFKVPIANKTDVKIYCKCGIATSIQWCRKCSRNDDFEYTASWDICFHNAQLHTSTRSSIPFTFGSDECTNWYDMMLDFDSPSFIVWHGTTYDGKENDIKDTYQFKDVPEHIKQLDLIPKEVNDERIKLFNPKLWIAN